MATAGMARDVRQSVAAALRPVDGHELHAVLAVPAAERRDRLLVVPAAGRDAPVTADGLVLNYGANQQVVEGPCHPARR